MLFSKLARKLIAPSIFTNSIRLVNTSNKKPPDDESLFKMKENSEAAELETKKYEGLIALDAIKSKQKLTNAFTRGLEAISGYDIGVLKPESYNKKIVLKEFEKYLKTHVPVQISKACYLESMRLIDHYNNRNDSVFSDPVVLGVLSGKIHINDANITDLIINAYIKGHISQQNMKQIQKENLYGDYKFITGTVGHSFLTNEYISAKKLGHHFEKTNQPIYSMVNWGYHAREVCYTRHSIVVYGVNETDYIKFWDVSDKLPPAEPRARYMHIEEFNDRRNLFPVPGEMRDFKDIVRFGWSRSFIYYYGKRKTNND